MSKNIQSIRGMHDFAPAEAASMRMLDAASAGAKSWVSRSTYTDR